MAALRWRKAVLCLALGLLCLVVATVFKILFINEIPKPNTRPRSWSAAEAKEKGWWAGDVMVSCKTFGADDHLVTIVDAWMEDVWEKEYALGWFPYWQDMNIRLVVLQLHQPKDIKGTYHFRFPDGGGFSSNPPDSDGDVRFWWTIPKDRSPPSLTVEAELHHWGTLEWLKIATITLVPTVRATH